MMNEKKTVILHQTEKAVDLVIERLGRKLVLGTPIGLGKPNVFINGVFDRAMKDPSINLKMITGLSLERPPMSNDLEKRFLGPLRDRIWGKNYPDLTYPEYIRKGTLPSNIEVSEWYFKAGAMLNAPLAQQSYASTNFTHAARDAYTCKVNLMALMITSSVQNGKVRYSASSNPDTIIDMKELMDRKKMENYLVVGLVNKNLPYLYGDSEVDQDFFDIILEGDDFNAPLFATPKPAVSPQDHLIALHVSTLIKDGGTLQIGIGSLGDAIAHGLQLRHQQNDTYKKVINELHIPENFKEVIDEFGETGKFKEGLYAATEMFVDIFMNLNKSGIVKREVYPDITIQRLLNDKKISEKVDAQMFQLLLDNKAISYKLSKEDFDYLNKFGIIQEDITFTGDHLKLGSNSYPSDLTNNENLDAIKNNCLGSKLKCARWIDAGFYLGPQSFYDEMKSMPVEDLKKINMTSVLVTNQLYSHKEFTEELKIIQRKEARFVNTGLKVTLSGAIVSDGLDDGRVISGVGGQYNFIDQANALPDARSILMIKSTRGSGDALKSNIVYNYGHMTIPRHLRDIVINEYGIADLRAQTDKTVIERLLNITDSRFQEELLREAKFHKKIPEDYQIPEKFRNNYPAKISGIMKKFKKEGLFPTFPFGTDFTDEEIALGKSLRGLKAKLTSSKISLVIGLLKEFKRKIPTSATAYLKRMDLENPSCLKEKITQKLIICALKDAKVI